MDLLSALQLQSTENNNAWPSLPTITDSMFPSLKMEKTFLLQFQSMVSIVLLPNQQLHFFKEIGTLLGNPIMEIESILVVQKMVFISVMEFQSMTQIVPLMLPPWQSSMIDFSLHFEQMMILDEFTLPVRMMAPSSFLQDLSMRLTVLPKP